MSKYHAYFTEEVMKQVKSIMLTALIKTKKYSFEQSKEIVSELEKEIHGGALRDGNAVRETKRLLKNPWSNSRDYINEAITWSSTEKGHDYWSNINRACKV